MTEPGLEGYGLSSASRRSFLWLGGSLTAGLLLLPSVSFAAKVAGKVARKDTKSRAASSRRATPRGTAGKASAKRAPAGKTSRAVAKPASGTASAARRSAGGAHVRSTVPTRAQLGTPARLELPSSYAPGRAFSFGGGASQLRELSLYCVHTGERLDIEYYVDGRYEPEALRAVDHLLRDYHNDEVCQFDPRVLNQLHEVRRALGSREAFHVYSGYRSPETNERYRRAGARVAERSFHLTGQAIDVSLPGRDVRQIRNVAIAMRAGGVGYYPRDGFVHLDSGPVRRW